MGENVMPMMMGNCCGWGSDALAAGIGGFFGGSLANGGFGGWGGNWNRGGCCGNGLEKATLDAVNGVASAVNNANTSNLQGLCNVQASGDRNAAQILNSNAQGFAGINTAVYTNGYETRLGIQGASQAIIERLCSMQAQQAQCCCETKQLIQQEGCATRALITDNYVKSLQDQLCQERNKVTRLENQADIAAQTAAIFARYPVTSSTTPTTTA